MSNTKKSGGWQPGQSGNPKGRPIGKSDVGKLRALIAQHLPEIIEQLTEKARAGDIQAARLLLERVVPPVKAMDPPVHIDMARSHGLTERGETVLNAMADGLLTPGQAGTLLGGLGSMARIKEIDELTIRIEALEKR
jgi:hypothetical protein